MPRLDPKGYVEWLTKSEAALALNVTEKTIERMAARKQLQQAFRPVPNRRPVAVFNPDDVKAILDTRKAVFIAPAPESTSVALATRNAQAGEFFAAFEAVLNRAPAVPLDKKIFLSLDEAVAYTGLPKAHLLRLLQSGKLPAVKMGRWCIRRTELETLSLEK